MQPRNISVKNRDEEYQFNGNTDFVTLGETFDSEKEAIEFIEKNGLDYTTPQMLEVSDLMKIHGCNLTF